MSGQWMPSAPSVRVVITQLRISCHAEVRKTGNKNSPPEVSSGLGLG